MYIINYKNGITEECEGTLEQAKKLPTMVQLIPRVI